MSALRLIFGGSGEFGVPALRKLVESARNEVVQVISQPDRPAGRGLRLTPTPIAQFALEKSLLLVRTANINEEELQPADVMLVIAFGQKMAPHVVNHPRLGSINLHASLLPKYRGAAPVNWAVIYGESITGNSIIRLAPKMDAGAILAQSQLPIGPLETAGELHDRLAQDGAGLIARVLEQLASGTAVETPQDDSQASLAPKLRREDARIDWTRPAAAIANQIRGMFPWPGCRVGIVEGGRSIARVTLVRAAPGSIQETRGRPGEILETGFVASGDGAVEMVELQPEGKRPMPLDAYRNGHSWRAGLRLESI